MGEDQGVRFAAGSDQMKSFAELPDQIVQPLFVQFPRFFDQPIRNPQPEMPRPKTERVLQRAKVHIVGNFRIED